jgi:hypothetical protein
MDRPMTIFQEARMSRSVAALDLRITHPSVAPAAVSKRLGLDLGRGWMAGEPKTTPRGTQLKGVRKSSYCSFSLEESFARGPAAAICKWNKRLMRHARYFQSLDRDGGTVEYYLWWYWDPKSGTAGEVFDRALLLATADIGLGLSVEVLTR